MGSGRFCSWCGVELQGSRRRWCRESHRQRFREAQSGKLRSIKARLGKIVAAVERRERDELAKTMGAVPQRPVAGSSSSGTSTGAVGIGDVPRSNVIWGRPIVIWYKLWESFPGISGGTPLRKMHCKSPPMWGRRSW